tara:strand:- start:1794 stop:1961 length:168 start_codon:yes stop_codon:yes gene_type:complete
MHHEIYCNNPEHTFAHDSEKKVVKFDLFLFSLNPIWLSMGEIELRKKGICPNSKG